MKPWKRVGLQVALLSLSCSVAGAAPSCAALAPSADADRNYENISACLSSSDRAAHLASGVFPVSRRIKMPTGTRLSADADTVIKAANGGAAFNDNMILELTGMNVVQDLALIGDGLLKPGCCTAIVGITGSGSKIQNTDISDEDASRRAAKGADVRTTGLYFLGDPDSHDNLAGHLRIHGLNFGVIFRKGLLASARNRVTGSDIFDLSCDSFSFAGGGIADGNHIHDAGFDCKQRPVPIPGGGFYALNNSEPVSISNNTITDICGVGFDIVGSKNFTITGNNVSQEKQPFGGRYPYCSGYPAKLVDVGNFTVADNYFYVADTSPIGIAFKYFPAFRHATGAYYDLAPHSNQQIYAVRLLHQSETVAGNRFENNRMIAECRVGGPCDGGGVGLFVGPGVGGKAGNVFIGNTIVGSSVPAIRCGQDSYEGNRFCRKADAAGNCASGDEPEDSERFHRMNDACGMASASADAPLHRRTLRGGDSVARAGL